jgi:hypothetical protein
MKTFLIFFSIFILSSSYINSQSFELGFDLEAHQIRVNDQYGTKILGGVGPPISIHFNSSYIPLENISIVARVGRNLHLEFAGWEFGIAGKYRFLEPLFTSAGILHHSNEGGSGSNTWGTNFASILMFHAGIGVDLSSAISLEISYYLPTSKELIGWSITSRYFKSMVKLGFVFGWDL